MDVGIIIGIISIIVPFLLWLFPPDSLRKRWKIRVKDEKLVFMIRLSHLCSPYWVEVEDSAEHLKIFSMVENFNENCQQFFQLNDDYFVDNVDPSFDITLINETGSAVVVEALGAEIVSVAHQAFAYGEAQATEIIKQASYLIKIPNIQEIITKELGHPLGALNPIQINRILPVNNPSPLRLDNTATFRYDITLVDYIANMPNLSVIRFWVKTHKGTYNSDFLHIFTL